MVKEQVTALLDSQDVQKLDELSASTGRSTSSIIREAVKKYLKSLEGGG